MCDDTFVPSLFYSKSLVWDKPMEGSFPRCASWQAWVPEGNMESVWLWLPRPGPRNGVVVPHPM